MPREPGKLSYISPTSYMLWEKNPVGFWMRYLAPPELKVPRSPQTPQMAVGNVFDTHIKFHLASTVGKADLPADMLESGLDPRYHGKGSPDKYDNLVLYEGLRAYHAYKESPAMALLLRGVTNVEVPAEAVRWVTGNSGVAVPIWGKPDAELFRQRRVIMDWKVSGAFANSSPSPEPGYSYRFVKRALDGESRWVDEGPHHRSFEPMELLNERWAIQLAMYAWLMGDSPGSEVTVQIDKVLLVDTETVEIYVYRNTIGRDFQLSLFSKLQLMWQKIEKGEILPPELRGAPPELLLAMVEP